MYDIYYISDVQPIIAAYFLPVMMVYTIWAFPTNEVSFLVTQLIPLNKGIIRYSTAKLIIGKCAYPFCDRYEIGAKGMREALRLLELYHY